MTVNLTVYVPVCVNEIFGLIEFLFVPPEKEKFKQAGEQVPAVQKTSHKYVTGLQCVNVLEVLVKSTMSGVQNEFLFIVKLEIGSGLIHIVLVLVEGPHGFSDLTVIKYCPGVLKFTPSTVLPHVYGSEKSGFVLPNLPDVIVHPVVGLILQFNMWEDEVV